jgi:hypothetical protein
VTAVIDNTNNKTNNIIITSTKDNCPGRADWRTVTASQTDILIDLCNSFEIHCDGMVWTPKYTIPTAFTISGIYADFFIGYIGHIIRR